MSSTSLPSNGHGKTCQSVFLEIGYSTEKDTCRFRAVHATPATGSATQTTTISRSIRVRKICRLAKLDDGRFAFDLRVRAINTCSRERRAESRISLATSCAETRTCDISTFPSGSNSLKRDKDVNSSKLSRLQPISFPSTADAEYAGCGNNSRALLASLGEVH